MYLLILHTGIWLGCEYSLTPRPLYPLNRRAGGQKSSYPYRESNNERVLGGPAHRLVTLLSELRLSNHREMRESTAVPGEVRKLYKQRWVIVIMPPLPPTPINLFPYQGLSRESQEKSRSLSRHERPEESKPNFSTCNESARSTRDANYVVQHSVGATH